MLCGSRGTPSLIHRNSTDLLVRRATLIVVNVTYRLSAGKTLNLELITSDDVRLGAWFVAADGFYQKHLRLEPPVKNSPVNLDEKRYDCGIPDSPNSHATMF